MDTWEEVHLPVIRAIVEIADEDMGDVSPHKIVERTGLDKETVQRALRALEHEHPPVFTTAETVLSGEIVGILGVTGEARRLAGQWPQRRPPEDEWIERLLSTLDTLADNAPPEERTRWQRVRDVVGTAPRDFLVQLAAAMVVKGG